MCKYEMLNREDKRLEKHQRKQAKKIHKVLIGTLAPTTEEWIKWRTKNEIAMF